MKDARKQVLVLSDYFLPGYKAGGPIRTLANLIDYLSNDIRFKVITRDNDLGDTKQYSGIKRNTWNSINKAEVYYLEPSSRSITALRKLLQTTDYEILYLNSLFSLNFAIKPLLLKKLGLIRNVPVVLAPRGEFSAGALAIKPFKKRLFLAVAKALGLYKSVIWQASSTFEEADIRRWFGGDIAVVIAPNLTTKGRQNGDWKRKQTKIPGLLKLVFISRISRMKNLHGALEMLRNVKGNIIFDIYGPIEDQAYWAECEKKIKQLSSNIKVRYCGVVENDQVASVFSDHDLFFFPTRGENFGHVILESMLSGCPVLISDQTPWRNLADKGVGWDFQLSEPQRFRDLIETHVKLGPEEYACWSAAAYNYALEISSDYSNVQLNRNLFENALID